MMHFQIRSNYELGSNAGLNLEIKSIADTRLPGYTCQYITPNTKTHMKKKRKKKKRESERERKRKKKE